MAPDRRFGNHNAMHVSLVLMGLLARSSVAAQPPPPPEVPPAINPHNVSVTHDPYQFAAGSSVEQHVRLTGTPEGARFTWPKVSATSWDTALLAVQSWGAESQPWVELSAGSVTTRH